ncbi:MAG: CHAT domain-containing protein [Candidatus Viridilinea halotolerans]|uniref:CHAT domain-containing protein n=1 Tax=Candidatus Viridilinea halotolerans TaxID=2491704 RepID=A0A426TWI7_9CHLR|nr:MAG: CHAT domain-containing protein [Candidatus Viridilinea halotolerans]
MNDEALADLLCSAWETPAWPEVLVRFRERLTLPLLYILKQRADGWRLRNNRQMERTTQIAEALAHLLATPQAAALTALMRGSASHSCGEFQQARVAYERAATFAHAASDHVLLARVLISSIGTLQELGLFGEAATLAVEARLLCVTLGAERTLFLAVLEQNLSALAIHTHAYQEALAAAQCSRELFLQIPAPERAAHVVQNLALALEGLGRFSEAEAHLLAARADLDAADYADELSRLDMNLGLLAGRRGRYPEALRLLEQAEQGFQQNQNGSELAFLRLMRAQLYHALNLHHDAFHWATQAEHGLRRARMRAQAASALQIQAAALRHLYGAAAAAPIDQALRRAARLLQHGGPNSGGRRLELLLECLAWDVAQGRLRAAAQRLRFLNNQPVLDEAPALQARLALLRLRYALQTRHDPASVRPHLVALVARAQALALHEVAIEATVELAHLALRGAERQAAHQHLLAALQQIEYVRQQIMLDEPAIAFAERYLPVYDEALALAHDDANTLLLLALATLRAGARHPSPRLPTSGATHAQWQALRERWHRLAHPLDAALPADGSQNERLHLEAELADAWRRMQAAHLLPSATSNTARQIAELHADPAAAQRWVNEAQGQLAPDTWLLHYYALHGMVHCICVQRDTIRPMRDLAPQAQVERALQAWRMLRDLHATGQLGAAHPQERLLLQRLYAWLIAPLRHHERVEQRLVFSLPATWHDLPLAALYAGPRYLVEDAIPVVQTSPLRPPGGPDAHYHTQALVLGYSNEGMLPGALREAELVAQTWRAVCPTTLLLEQSATGSQLMQQVATCRVLHLATHALFRADNPLFSWFQLADGRMTVADLYQLQLRAAPLVILSACETGRGAARGGGVLGMGRGLLAAGASAVIGGLWRVDDQYTQALMHTLTQTLAKGNSDAASALAHAQREALAQGLPPAAWAGWMVFGG